MKRLFVIPMLLIALALPGCATLNKSVLDGGVSITATIQNPVTLEQQAAVEVAYGIAASSAVSYARLPRCKPGQSASVTNLCSQWSIVQKLMAANRIAYRQIVNLRAFMDANDKFNAITAFNAARSALADFKATALSTGI